ncbi:MAG: HEPN domain-containing protein [Chitinophagales bacterium]|nr:HEPN domain-containing protein [Chitinophagales bacterium]
MSKNDLDNELALTGKAAKRFLGLLFNAYRDYKAARLLFNSGLLREACSMANQALEKQMKAYIEVNGGKETQKHNTVALFNTMKHMKLKPVNKLNRDFFTVLTKVYDTRYYESLPSKFRYTILKNKFLAELDHSYLTLRPLMGIKSENFGNGMSEYDRDVEIKEPVLFENNHILNNISKPEFLRQKEFFEEFILWGSSPLTVYGTLPYSRDNAKFIYSGIKITSSTQFKITDWDNEELK